MSNTPQTEKSMARDLYIANVWVQEVKTTIKRLYENPRLYVDDKAGNRMPNLSLIRLEQTKLDWARKNRTKIKEKILATYGEHTLGLISKHVWEEWDRRREINRRKALPALLLGIRAVDGWVITAQNGVGKGPHLPRDDQRSQIGAYARGAGQPSSSDRPKTRVPTKLEQRQEELGKARKEQQDLEEYMNLVYGKEVLTEFRTTGKIPEAGVGVQNAAKETPADVKEEGKEVKDGYLSYLW